MSKRAGPTTNPAISNRVAVRGRIWPVACGFIAGVCVALVVAGVKFVDSARDTELRVPASERWIYCQHSGHTDPVVSSTRVDGPP